jgi:hypothetical protein
MKRTISITLTFLLVFFAGTALADRGENRSNQDSYRSKGDRIERHLDAKGDRIEQRFDRKAAYFAEQGKYRKARHFQKKGDQINRHLDRKGDRISSRFDRRGYNRHGYNQGDRDHRYRSYARTRHQTRNDRHYYNYSDRRPHQQRPWRSRGWYY